MKYLLIAVALIVVGCDVDINSDRVDGNGSIKKEARNISGFKGVEVEGPFDVVLVQGSSFSVEIEGDDNLLQYIDIKKHDQDLEISEADGYNLRSKTGIKIRVQMPVVEDISVSGSGSVKSEAPLENPDKIEIDIAGSGNVNLEVKSPRVDVGIGGSGTAKLSGSTRKLDVSIGGSGDCMAEDLLSEDCEVSIGGSGTARVYASVSLKGSIGGSGDIYYRGEPKNVNKSVGGSGSIQPVK
ncbi:MAG: head GIN domain-containing protein [Bacteroidota bacterium]